MGDGATLVGEAQEIAGREIAEVAGDLLSFLGLIGAHARQLDPIPAVGVLDEPRAVESFAALAGAAELVRTAHGIGRGDHDGVAQSLRCDRYRWRNGGGNGLLLVAAPAPAANPDGQTGG